jgi:tetratricopeptide (TPR) repeat protein
MGPGLKRSSPNSGLLASQLQTGFSLHQQGKLDEAQLYYESVLRADPKNFDALHLLGVMAHQRQNHAAAITLLDRALQHNPRSALAHLNRGNTRKEMGDMQRAITDYERAITIDPGYAEAYVNLGIALQELQQPDQALTCYRKAIGLKPDFAEAYFALGNALQEHGQMDAAIVSLREATRLRPGFAAAYCNLGNLFKEMGRFDDAITVYAQAIHAQPDFAVAYCNLGNVQKEKQQFQLAIASYAQATTLNPDFAEAHWNRSLVHLLLGEFEAAWPLFEWRWKAKKNNISLPDFRRPLWLGEQALTGKTILICWEQGFGDTIQFCRYVSVVQALGAKVLLVVPPSLVPLLKTLDGVDQVLGPDEPISDFDYYCPLMSLPLAFRTTLTTIPTPKAYLHANESRSGFWAAKLPQTGRKRVGIAWSGSTTNKSRSLPLAEFISHLPRHLDYVCLQKDVTDAERDILSHANMVCFNQDIAHFGDTAALCGLMDMVISIDTSAAHLSGAMGKPTWVLLPHLPDWRWLLNRSDTPWYPSMRLYRQEEAGVWDSVLQRVTHELGQLFPPSID